jgi:hypothetical protein
MRVYDASLANETSFSCNNAVLPNCLTTSIYVTCLGQKQKQKIAESPYVTAY